jgi:SprT-like family
MTPTLAQMNAFQSAFGHFNNALFGGRLPQVHLTFSRPSTKKAAGRFWAEGWESNGVTIHEIALNPMHLNQGASVTAQTLVHEMVHLWQHHEGHPSRPKYHNNEWCKMMHDAGLEPVLLDGSQRQRVTQKVIPGGRFARALERLDRDALMPLAVPVREPDRSRNKTLYTCNCPRSAVLGRPGLTLTCRTCGVDLRTPAVSRASSPRGGARAAPR